MKRKTALISIGLLISSAWVIAASTPSWRLVGSQPVDINLDKDTWNPSLALDAKGNQVVAWAERTGKSENIYVKKWNGSNWTLLGTGFLDVNTDTDANSPSLALDRNGDPVVAWSERDTTSSNIYVKRWDGINWKLIGSGALDFNPGKYINADFPSLAVDVNGNPTVAWSEFSGADNNLYVKTWTGSNWNLVGDSFLDSAENQNAVEFPLPSLVLDSTGRPSVAWQEYDGEKNQIFVKRWVANKWEQLPVSLPLPNTTKDATSPSLQLNAKGEPLVAWAGSTKVIGSNEPLNQVAVSRWDGTTWIQMGGTFLNFKATESAYKPKIALTLNDIPTVAWEENDGPSANIYVKRLEGSSWRLIGDTALDINIAKDAFQHSLAVDVSGNPTVAWKESDGASDNVYVKRFNPTP